MAFFNMCFIFYNVYPKKQDLGLKTWTIKTNMTCKMSA